MSFPKADRICWDSGQDKSHHGQTENKDISRVRIHRWEKCWESRAESPNHSLGGTSARSEGPRRKSDMESFGRADGDSAKPPHDEPSPSCPRQMR